MKPSFKNPARIQTSPETAAIIAPSAAARSGSWDASGATTASVTAASDESGPSTRMGLGPNSA
jgi:hypothetical protein